MSQPLSVDKADFKKRLGAQLRALRAERRLTQVQLAKDAGVSPVRIVEIENETGDPRLSTLLRVAEAAGLALRISIDPREAA